MQIGQYRIQGIELVEVSVFPDWRARTSISGPFPVVQTFQRAFREIPGFDPFGQCICIFGDVVENPVHPGHPWIGRVRGIWIVGSNPLVTGTQGLTVEKALRDHMEYTVVSDLFMTPTARLADLVLPAAPAGLR